MSTTKSNGLKLIKTDRVFYVYSSSEIPSLVESLSFLLPLQANFKLSYHQDVWTTSLVTLRKKEFERRAALTPTTAKKLLDAGFDIFVERDEQRIFNDSEYEA
jgi:hypothetical protein